MIESDWVEEFAKLYFSLNEGDRQKGFQILQDHKPKMFYRYVNEENTYKFLKDDRPWHSHLDVYVKSDWGDKNEGRWYKLNRENVPENLIERIDYIESEFLYNEDEISPPKEGSVARELFKTASFTTTHLSYNMWYEYADDSKGICLEYDTEWKKPLNNYYLFNNFIFPVMYSKDPVDLTENVLHAEDLMEYIVNYFCYQILLFKNKKYSEENEWRTICTNFTEENADGEGLNGAHYDHSIIPKTIYLGKNTSSELQEKVIKYASIKPVTVYKMHDLEEEPELIYNPEILF